MSSTVRLLVITACLGGGSIQASAQTTNLSVSLRAFPSNDPGEFTVSLDGSPILTDSNVVDVTSHPVMEGALITLSIDATAGTTITDYATKVECRSEGFDTPITESFLKSTAGPRVFQFAAPTGGHGVRCSFSNLLGAELPGALDDSIQCEAEAVPYVLRAEGLAEIVSDVSIRCTSSEATPSAEPLVGTLKLYLNTNVTNNVDFGEGPLITDAVAVVNENNCTAPSTTGSTVSCGADPRFQDPQYGALLTGGSLSGLEWTNFTLPRPGSEPDGVDPFPDVTTVRISGVRIDASSLDWDLLFNLEFREVFGYVTFCAETCVPIATDVIYAGVPLPGITTESDRVSDDAFELTLSEGFATAFKTQGGPTFHIGYSPDESAYFAPGSNNGGGAVSGTRLRLRFLGFEAGSVASLPRQIDLGTGGYPGDGLHLALVEGADASGAGGTPTGLTGDQAVSLIDGSGFATYEVVDSDLFKLEQVVIPITFLTGGENANGSVTGSFAPVSDVIQASASAPEPRFTEGLSTTGPQGAPLILDVQMSGGFFIGSPLAVTAEVIDLDPGVAQVVATLRHEESGASKELVLARTSGSGYAGEFETDGLLPGPYVLSLRAADLNVPALESAIADVRSTSGRCSYRWLDGLVDRARGVPSRGGSYALPAVVSPSPGCTWELESLASWVSTEVVPPASEGDNWTIHYSVEPNTSPDGREAVFRIVGTPERSSVSDPFHTIRQAGSRATGVGAYSDGLWRLDADGDGVFEPGTDRNFALGFPGAQAFVGDWNGDGRDETAVYSNGNWFIDFNGNDVWDGEAEDRYSRYGWAGATPVIGDWDGDGRTQIGVYANGFWFLDRDGSLGLNTSDIQFAFGFAGATPIVGDWNGDGRDQVGVFANGFWFLDYDGDTLWDGGTNDRLFAWGWDGVEPIIGDWNGDGRDKAGAWVNGFWLLDYDGDNVWDGGTTDRLFGWGAGNSTPVIGDWNNDGADSAGAFLDGNWVLDVNGDALWDGGAVDLLFDWGAAGDEPVVGRW